MKNLCKSFGSLKVLNNVSFNIKEGNFVCVVGPSGCGKTTLLKIIAGLIDHDSGEVFIDGKPADPRLHRIGYVPQTISLLPWRTVFDNVKFGLEIRGEAREEAERKVRDAVEFVGLKGFEGFYPHEISAGMQARVAIARALVIDPDLMLMDEPLANLDAQMRYLIQMEILRIWDSMRKTIIFVTHNIEEAVFLAERVIVLSKLPAKVKAEVPITLKRPRNCIDPEFVEIRRMIKKLLE